MLSKGVAQHTHSSELGGGDTLAPASLTIPGYSNKWVATEFSVASETVLQQVTDLTFTLEEGQSYIGGFSLFVGTTLQTTGIKVGMLLTGATYAVQYGSAMQWNTTNWAEGFQGSDSILFNHTPAQFTSQRCYICGTFAVDGAAALQSIYMQLAQWTSSATPVKILKGSSAWLRQVD